MKAIAFVLLLTAGHVISCGDSKREESANPAETALAVAATSARTGEKTASTVAASASAKTAVPLKLESTEASLQTLKALRDRVCECKNAARLPDPIDDALAKILEARRWSTAWQKRANAPGSCSTKHLASNDLGQH